MSPLTGRNAHPTSLVVTVRFCCSDGDWISKHAPSTHTVWAVTIGSPITNPLLSVTPPGQYTQSFGAAVRLSLSRITSNLAGVCGASFPVN